MLRKIALLVVLLLSLLRGSTAAILGAPYRSLPVGSRSMTGQPLAGQLWAATGTESPLGTGGASACAEPGDCFVAHCAAQNNRLNSVGQFCSSATKLTLHSSSLLRQGCPLDPSETLEKFGSHGIAARILSSFSDQRASPLDSPRLRRKTPGPNPGFFVTTTNVKTERQWP